MDWSGARERLGAELIGARETIAWRWRVLLADSGLVATSLEGLASELILQSGAALADGLGPEAPWNRCGGVLRVDARGPENRLGSELTTLWKAITGELSRLCLNDAEEQAATEVLAGQLDAALRGASAEVNSLLRGDTLADPALRFGGVKVLCWPSAVQPAATRAA